MAWDLPLPPDWVVCTVLWRTVPLTCEVWPKSGWLASGVIAQSYVEYPVFMLLA